MPRRRIGLVASFREALKAGAKVPGGDGDAGFYATAITAVWFWIRRAPVDENRLGSDSNPRIPKDPTTQPAREGAMSGTGLPSDFKFAFRSLFRRSERR